MADFLLPLNRLVHENLSVILNFAFARRPLQQVMADSFIGEWKYLHKTVFELSESRANKAAFELALYLRVFDDSVDHVISDAVTADMSGPLLRLEFDGAKPPEDLVSIRQVANKIIHASALEWDVSLPEMPKLICLGRESEKWRRAVIDLRGLCAALGALMH